MEELKSYYVDYRDELIDRLKRGITTIENIIDDQIDSELKDDKLLSVLKAKRQATEDVIWMAKKIDELEIEKSGKSTEVEITSEVKGPVNHAKERAALRNKKKQSELSEPIAEE